MSRSRTLPSPTVIRPATSTMETSAVVRVDSSVLTGACPRIPRPSLSRRPNATVAVSPESVRTTIRERPSFSTSWKKTTSSGAFSSGVGFAFPPLSARALPPLAPVPAPARPNSAAAPKPSAKTGPTPGRSKLATATPADAPVAIPINPPTVAPNSLATVFASDSDRVRKTMACSGTFPFKSSPTASSARSREENTPITVSIEILRLSHGISHTLNPESENHQQVQPKQAHKMPVHRCSTQGAQPQYAAMQFADHIRKSEDSADYVQGMQHRENIKERTARSGRQIHTLRPQLQPRGELAGHKEATEKESPVERSECRLGVLLNA